MRNNQAALKALRAARAMGGNTAETFRRMRTERPVKADLVPQIPCRKLKSGRYGIGREGHEIELVNPEDRDYATTRFVLAFGAYGWTKLMVWADSLDDALEIAAEWLAKHAPGHVMEAYGDEHKELIKEACEEASLPYPPVAPREWDDDDYMAAIESAEADLTYTESGYLTSYEWTIIAENPTRADLASMVCP